MCISKSVDFNIDLWRMPISWSWVVRVRFVLISRRSRKVHSEYNFINIGLDGKPFKVELIFFSQFFKFRVSCWLFILAPCVWVIWCDAIFWPIESAYYFIPVCFISLTYFYIRRSPCKKWWITEKKIKLSDDSCESLSCMGNAPTKHCKQKLLILNLLETRTSILLSVMKWTSSRPKWWSCQISRNTYEPR